MKPVLFTIGNFNVYSFGIFLSLSFLLSTFLVWKFAREEIKEEIYLDAYLYTCIFTLISARMVYIIRNFDQFGTLILKYILVRETPGLSLLGGLFGGFFFLWWYCAKNKLKFIHLLDLFSVALSFSLVLIKIGQQFGGAAFGKETNFFLKIRIIGLPNYHHPVELYEAFLFLLLFLVLYLFYYKRHKVKLPDGFIFCLFALFLGFIIFALEFLKVYQVYLYGLSFRQFLALGIVISIFYPLFKRIKSILLVRKNKNI